MLPKPNFDVNLRPNSINTMSANVSQSTPVWFQYNSNQSLNQQFVNQQPVNSYPNYNFPNNYANYGNQYPYQSVLWNQNQYNANPMNTNPNHNSNAWNQPKNNNNYNQNNNKFNQNYNRGYGQQNQRNDYQNKRFKNNNNCNSNNNQKGQTFNCDTCCRWFPTQELYDKHLSEHIVCGLDECTFRAHPKVIESHQRMQHFCFKDRTLVKKFMTLDTKEDIEKWREERRRQFPTKDNIRAKDEQKEKQRLEAIERREQREEEERKVREQKESQKSDQLVQQESDESFDKMNKNKKFNKNNKKMRGGGRQRPGPNPVPNRKLTLFQKLLRNDIQKNEEKIMKAIELIVENNFFDK